MSMVSDSIYEENLVEIAAIIKAERVYDGSSWDMALDSISLELSRIKFPADKEIFLKKCDYEGVG